MALSACPLALAGLLGSLGLLPIRSDDTRTLELESPLDWQVFQRRDDREGEIRLRGRAPEGSESVIVTIRAQPAPGAETVRRLEIPFDRSSGRFDAAVKGPAGGWYEVEVSACQGSAAIASTKVAHVGIGEVFIVAGQSNSSNHGSERLRPTSGKVAAFHGKRWTVADDPQPGASGDGGSFVPAFGDALAAMLGLPIGVTSVGEGGTSVREWLPRGSRMSRQPTTGAHVRAVGPGEWECTGELFDRLTGRVAALGPRGFRAVLWHQGESDAGQARSGYPADRQISGEEYRAFLVKLLRDVTACAGEEVTWFTAQATYHSEADPSDEEFRSAQASLWSSGLALQGPDTDLLRGDHRAGVHLSAKGLRRHGELWAEKVGAWLEESRGATGAAMASRVERGLPAAAAWRVVSVSSEADVAGAVVNLRCESKIDPQGIDVPNPRLSWRLQDERRGALQTAYQVLVATREPLLKQDRADAWDSGRVTSDQRIVVRYGGSPLLSETRYWWKVRAWDKDGRPTAWSPPAGFLTGKLRPEDWRGKWIGPDLVRRGTPADVLGFAVEAKRADEEHWVQVDLGKPQRMDRIVLHPMRHNDPAAGGWIDGYAFPVRFRIDVSDDVKLVRRDNVADFTGQDYANPGLVPPAFDARGLTARYARLTVTKLWPRGPGLPFVFTLGELQVFSGSDNIAAGAAVEASASVEGYGWSKRQLTDGKALCPPPGPSPGEKPAHQHGAIYLRKDFELAKPVVRAVLSFSGLGFSEAAIDGRKVGDYVIGPGFTDYDHRVPYLTLDVSDRFAADDRSTTNNRSATDDRSGTAGRRRLDVILADGWYALDRDPWHQPGLARSPYVDLPKLRLDLRLLHADGSETFIASDESWMWSTGEITRSWIAQEDIDLRKSGEAARAWRPAALVPAPRGRWLHQKEPFNHIVEEFRPLSMRFDAGAGTAAYEVGREINGWVRFRARGPEGRTVHITTIPSDPTYARTSAFVLAGSDGKETYEPRFFYSALQRVKVSGLVEEPAPEDLVVCSISSLRTPAGAFRCSDELVNWLEQAVRRTAINYTTFLPNDPVREWKAWTQDIQSMFGSMFYLFAESQAMYERWQYDLLDSQRADGNIGNVAPGPIFDDYNSPWWGGCGVWLPWEWRLAYGDDTLLQGSYAAMKRYVEFLDRQASTAGGLQSWGLADWLPVEETPVAMINTPAHFHLARVVGQTADLLGLPEEARTYAEMAARVRDAFNRKFLDPSTGIYGEKGWKPQKGNWDVPGGLEPLHEIWWDGDRPCTQAGQVLPLALGLVPEAARPAVEAALLREIGAHKGRLSTGFVSTPYLLDLLADLDPEACWRLATTREFPSWHSMTRGSGNDLLKETWAGGQALMPSLGGSFARWCYRSLGGIRPDPEGPGFRKVIIRPAVVKGLDWVQCHHDAPRGRITSNWRREDGHLVMDVIVPPGTTATVFVPAKGAREVTEGGEPAAQGECVRLLREGPKDVVFEVASGHYEFTVQDPNSR